MKVLLALIVGAGVIAAATAFAGLGGLVISAVLVTVVLGAVTAARLPGNETVPNVEAADPSTVEASGHYRRLAMATTWAGGTVRDWDYGVRPVLAELVEQVAAERSPTGSGELSDSGRALLGDELWALVDPRGSLAGNRRDPGPGRDTLVRIIDRLEARE